jgi:hypothetical protein
MIEFRLWYSDRILLKPVYTLIFKKPSRRNGTVLLIVPFKINALIFCYSHDPGFTCEGTFIHNTYYTIFILSLPSHTPASLIHNNFIQSLFPFQQAFPFLLYVTAAWSVGYVRSEQAVAVNYTTIK